MRSESAGCLSLNLAVGLTTKNAKIAKQDSYCQDREIDDTEQREERGEKMLGKVSLSALFASRRLIGPLERNRRPRMTFGPLRTTDFRLRRAAPLRVSAVPLRSPPLRRSAIFLSVSGLVAARPRWDSLRFTPFVKQPDKHGSIQPRTCHLSHRVRAAMSWRCPRGVRPSQSRASSRRSC